MYAINKIDFVNFERYLINQNILGNGFRSQNCNGYGWDGNRSFG